MQAQAQNADNNTHLSLSLLLWCLQRLPWPDVAPTTVCLRDVLRPWEHTPGRDFRSVPAAAHTQQKWRGRVSRGDVAPTIVCLRDILRPREHAPGGDLGQLPATGQGLPAEYKNWLTEGKQACLFTLLPAP